MKEKQYFLKQKEKALTNMCMKTDALPNLLLKGFLISIFNLLFDIKISKKRTCSILSNLQYGPEIHITRFTQIIKL